MNGSFSAELRARGLGELRRRPVSTLQVNVGKRCNMACLHCHVDAGPKRTEVMGDAVFERVLELITRAEQLAVVDVTGGAPELHPRFRELVVHARRSGRRVIDRCNLTVLHEPGMEGLAEFLAAERVEVVASLPCYLEKNVDAQRGRGAYDGSIRALRRLNSLGYGVPGSGLTLRLVYNPGGPSLPPAQAALERDYRARLAADYGIAFDELLTLANMPIARFAHDLARDGRLAGYLALLEDGFNPATVEAVMCRDLLSVAWDGRLFDCDFNQMLELPLGAGLGTIFDLDGAAGLRRLENAAITTARHCFGCTAGAGSSCSGALR